VDSLGTQWRILAFSPRAFPLLHCASMMTLNALSFEQWKAQLCVDCQRMHKLLVFERTGDYVLRLFWENGMEPSVQAIVEDAESLESVETFPTDA
jgi:hypothetical protein